MLDILRGCCKRKLDRSHIFPSLSWPNDNKQIIHKGEANTTDFDAGQDIQHSYTHGADLKILARTKKQTQEGYTLVALKKDPIMFSLRMKVH